MYKTPKPAVDKPFIIYKSTKLSLQIQLLFDDNYHYIGQIESYKLKELKNTLQNLRIIEI